MIFAFRSFPAGLRHRTLLCTTSAGMVLLAFAAFAACDDFLGLGDGGEPQDQILFRSTRAGSLREDGALSSDIYRMNADGSEVQRLTDQSADYVFLGLSPDGTRLAYHRWRATDSNIWVMNIDGTGATQLTGINADERDNIEPHWPPDGSKLAFNSSRISGQNWDVYVMNADGSGVVEVSSNPSTDSNTNVDRPRGWSPDGRVVLLSYRDGTPQTYLVNADGSNLQPLFDGEDFLDPYWSPDGSKLIASSHRNGNGEIYVLNADGTGAVNISNNPGFDFTSWWVHDPWSPDGSRVAFEGWRGWASEIFVVGADGTGLVNVSNDDSGFDHFLAWTPDGARILFSSDRSGDDEIYLVKADGSRLVNLTNSPGSDEGFYAVWVPRK